MLFGAAHPRQAGPLCISFTDFFVALWQCVNVFRSVPVWLCVCEWVGVQKKAPLDKGLSMRHSNLVIYSCVRRIFF